MWLTELRRNLPADIVLHVVGTKADIVARDPSKREVPFERCIAYVAENLAPGMGSTPPPTATPLYLPNAGSGGLAAAAGGGGGGMSATTGAGSSGILASGLATPQIMGPLPTIPAVAALSGGAGGEPRSPSSKRSSGFWGQEAGWDACHEISAESGEGVDEVFRVVTRKLVEQNRKMQQALLMAAGTPGIGGETPMSYYGGSGSAGGGAGGSAGGPGGYFYEGGAPSVGMGGYFDAANARGSFRVGRDRRSWMLFSPALTSTDEGGAGAGNGDQGDAGANGRRRKCC